MKIGLVALGCVLAFGPLGCSRQPREGDCPELDGGAPVDQALLAFLSRARAAHHRADQREDAGDIAQAVAELDALVGGPLLAGRKAPEVNEVLADTRARLADLRSRQGAFNRAEADVKSGLALLEGPSYFQGHLFEVQGLLEERRAKALAGSGDTAGAEHAKERALAAFQKAMEVQATVIERATGAQ